MNRKNSLSKQDWILAAFRALTAEGPQGIRVEAIARDLKVSKGSFYWHFRDVQALKAGMLAHWSQAGTDEVIESVSAKPGGARGQLYALIDASVDFDSRNVGGVLAETAIRDWARSNELAAKTLLQVESARLEFVCALFEKVGFSPNESRLRADLLYGGLIGMAHLTHWKHADIEERLRALLDMLLGEDS